MEKTITLTALSAHHIIWQSLVQINGEVSWILHVTNIHASTSIAKSICCSCILSCYLWTCISMSVKLVCLAHKNVDLGAQAIRLEGVLHIQKYMIKIVYHSVKFCSDDFYHSYSFSSYPELAVKLHFSIISLSANTDARGLEDLSGREMFGWVGRVYIS